MTEIKKAPAPTGAQAHVNVPLTKHILTRVCRIYNVNEVIARG